MNAPICCAKVQNTASDASVFAESPEPGHGETAERPIAEPKVRKTKESAAAVMAPAMTAPHSTNLNPAAAPAAGPTCTMVNAFYRSPSALRMTMITTIRPTIDDTVHEASLTDDCAMTDRQTRVH